MKDLNEREQILEQSFGLISGAMLFGLHEICKAAGSQWDIEKPETIDIVVTAENADQVYDWCRAIRSGYSVGLKKPGMAKIKAARLEAHGYLVREANNPSTSIQRKIELVKLTAKHQPVWDLY